MNNFTNNKQEAGLLQNVHVYRKMNHLPAFFKRSWRFLKSRINSGSESASALSLLVGSSIEPLVEPTDPTTDQYYIVCVAAINPHAKIKYTSPWFSQVMEGEIISGVHLKVTYASTTGLWLVARQDISSFWLFVIIASVLWIAALSLVTCRCCEGEMNVINVIPLRKPTS